MSRDKWAVAAFISSVCSKLWCAVHVSCPEVPEELEDMNPF